MGRAADGEASVTVTNLEPRKVAAPPRRKPPTRRAVLYAVALAALPRRARADDVDVAIVGAGAAGLAAAHALRREGVSFVLLEARERIGGRAFTDRSLGAPFDAGAHYIHWQDRNPWRGIAADLGIALTDEAGGGMHAFRDGVPISDAERRRRRGAYDRIEPLLEPHGADRSFAEAVRGEAPELADAARGLSLFTLGEEPDGVSIADYDQLWAGDNRVAAGGYGALVARYGADLPVELATPARRLRYGDGRVEIETERGTLRSAAAIVTLPVGVLQANALRFEPDLPDTTADALAGLHMGALTKVALRVDRAKLGPIEAATFVHTETGGAIIAFDVFADGTDLVLAHLGGERARSLCEAGERAAVDAVTASLSHMLGGRAAAATSAGRLAGWWSDPYARGSYSLARPGRLAAREALRTPIGGRVFIAGEASAGGGAMTVGGATLDGQRAAQAAVAFLRRR